MKADFLILATVALALTARADDVIQVYTVPKEQPSAQQLPSAPVTATMTGGETAILESPSADIHWTTPSGWQELAPTGVRVVNLLVPGANGKRAEVAVTKFPGSVGTELDNVNRWRGELALDAVDENGFSSEPVTVDGAPGKLYDFSGASLRTVVANVSRGGLNWFFKLKGDAATVALARPAFFDFLKSVKFGEPIEASIPAPNPHLGLAMPAAASAAPAPESSDEPKWDAPANWTESTAGPMVYKKYVVSGGSGEGATVSITAFPGAVGGTLANVNRWRGQLGLASIGADALPKSVEQASVAGAPATLVDISGVNSENGQPARLVAAIAPHGGQTWFYKLMGDKATVGREKAPFLKFLQSVRYP